MALTHKEIVDRIRIAYEQAIKEEDALMQEYRNGTRPYENVSFFIGRRNGIGSILHDLEKL